MGQNQQNLRQIQTVISQARNKLFTNFQRLEPSTIHGHMVWVEKRDKGRVKKWGAKYYYYYYVKLWLWKQSNFGHEA